jgi:hypothetical protein
MATNPVIMFLFVFLFYTELCVSVVATTAQLTLAQITVNFYHGDQWQPTLSLLPDLEMANKVDGDQANNQIVLWGLSLYRGYVAMNLIISMNSDGNVKCKKVRTDMFLGARSDKGQQHRQMFTYRGLHGALEV